MTHRNVLAKKWHTVCMYPFVLSLRSLARSLVVVVVVGWLAWWFAPELNMMLLVYLRLE